MAFLHQTKVQAVANHKVEYEWRSLLGIIGSWHEFLALQISKPDIIIQTTTEDYNKVFINGKEYTKKEDEKGD